MERGLSGLSGWIRIFFIWTNPGNLPALMNRSAGAFYNSVANSFGGCTSTILKKQFLLLLHPFK
jgi:hypothetical protein